MAILSTISAWALSFCLLVLGSLFNANVRRWAQEEGHDRYIIRTLALIPRRRLVVCVGIISVLLIWSLLSKMPQDQNIPKEVLLPQQPPMSTVPDNKPAEKHIETLLELYKSDFSNLVKLPNEITASFGNTDGTFAYNILVKVSISFDYNANIKFYSFYVPKSPDNQSFNFCTHLAKEYPNIINKISESVTTSAKEPGGPLISSRDLVFSGRIYLYHEDEMTLKQKAELEDLFKANGASVIFRGLDYQQTRWLQDSVPKNTESRSK
jgi:hypothetical protein